MCETPLAERSTRRFGEDGKFLSFGSGAGFMGGPTCDNSETFLFEMGTIYCRQMKPQGSC